MQSIPIFFSKHIHFSCAPLSTLRYIPWSHFVNSSLSLSATSDFYPSLIASNWRKKIVLSILRLTNRQTTINLLVLSWTTSFISYWESVSFSLHIKCDIYDVRTKLGWRGKKCAPHTRKDIQPFIMKNLILYYIGDVAVCATDQIALTLDFSFTN